MPLRFTCGTCWYLLFTFLSAGPDIGNMIAKDICKCCEGVEAEYGLPGYNASVSFNHAHHPFQGGLPIADTIYRNSSGQNFNVKKG